MGAGCGYSDADTQIHVVMLMPVDRSSNRSDGVPLSVRPGGTNRGRWQTASMDDYRCEPPG